MESLEARESLGSLTKTAERILLGLLLFVSSHARLIINPLFLIIAESLIRFIYLRELFLCALSFVDIGMELFGFFEICFLDIALR